MRSVEKVDLMVQVVASVFLVVSLCMHLTEVGFVGLGIAIIVTTCTGKIQEHDVSCHFTELMLDSVCRALASRPIDSNGMSPHDLRLLTHFWKLCRSCRSL
jgi:hypothetical protein